MEYLRLDRFFRYSPRGWDQLVFPPGEYLIGQGEMTAEIAREAIAGGYGMKVQGKVQNRYRKKVITERAVK